ncbi:flagellar hook-length control protein FliK [Aeromonas sp. SrichE-2G]|uniref:flagellar hook-length control protein FliK n=1 Tax=Aeromonas sp. SrichE-2G TaxID=2823359 RepID=UPI001B3221FB|nr:flagellar hook-length control protein FliK [Aeromonas sp. SrichE-2G]MBP4040444.1 flagellar hook-length control protein FliK [Aeromonas sp. SrichE-2G]
MIQTQLIKTPAQVLSSDSSASSALPIGGVEGGQLPVDGKVAFSDAMVRAQLMGKAPASQAALAPRVSDDIPQTNDADAKSLASGELAGEETQAAKASGDEPGLPPDDFLQQLQASLRQDVSLVHPAVPPSPQGESAPVDGNDLPPESQPLVESRALSGPGAEGKGVTAQPAPMPPGGPVPGSTGLTGLAQTGLVQTDLAQTGATAHGPLQSGLAQGDVTQSNLARDALAQTGLAKAELAPAADGETTQTAMRGDVQGVDKSAAAEAGASKGGQGAQADALVASDAEPGSAAPDQVAEKGTDKGTEKGTEKAADTGATRAKTEGPSPLSGVERAALLSKVIPSPEAAADKGTGTTVQLEAPTAQAGAARSFGEGLVKVGLDSQVAAQGDAPNAAGNQPREASTRDGLTGTTGDGKPGSAQDTPESKPVQAVRLEQNTTKPEQNTAQAGSPSPAATPVSTPEPTLAAPQQILARQESQGPQASLTALSAGIQQMESAPAMVKVAAEFKKSDMKGSLDDVGKPGGVETKGAGQTDATASLQPAQTAAGESKPAAELAARREPQSLPHLKLATPEAPVQLHQKVNLMLTDQLQQAEIQLDPLGLGKMKIQIQLDASSQASVHFVVQHGQTREMLEQAMPRLRDMLAGQGIQLGQTLVQQQPQQQSQQQAQQQGQSAFGGQGQQRGGFNGGQSQEGEGTARSLSLLVESANDAGIDFYA